MLIQHAFIRKFFVRAFVKETSFRPPYDCSQHPHKVKMTLLQGQQLQKRYSNVTLTSGHCRHKELSWAFFVEFALDSMKIYEDMKTFFT